jgi:hypothetical protein
LKKRVFAKIGFSDLTLGEFWAACEDEETIRRIREQVRANRRAEEEYSPQQSLFRKVDS